MRAAPLLAVALLAAVSGPARAQGDDDVGDGVITIDKGSFGVGLILGEPTGISARLYVAGDQAIQAAVGSAFVGGGLQVHADYVWHPWVLEERPSLALVGYVGPGLRTILYDAGRGAEDYLAIGVRAVVGMVFDFREVPIDAFLEVGGVGEYAFEDAEGFGVSLNAGAGARYYF